MKKDLICVECPNGCQLTADIGDNNEVVFVNGNKCPRGKEYAVSEVMDPRRILTSSVLCLGLDIKMLPVRTDKPIPKAKLLPAMCELKKIRVSGRVKAGDIIVRDFMGLGVDLIATRDISRGGENG